MATQLPMIMREKLKNVAEAEAEKARPPRPDPSHGVRENDHFYPSPVDIFIVRAMLVEGLHIPLLIVDNVLEEAEYWARSSTRIDFNEEQQSPMRIGGQSRRENVLLLRSLPIGLIELDNHDTLTQELAYDTKEAKPRPLKKEHDQSVYQQIANHPTPKLTNPVRKVVFSIKAHDQGWSTHAGEKKGTYEGSWTWFEAGKEQFDAEQQCDESCVPDARYETKSSKTPSLPACSLRPLQPPIESTEDPTPQGRPRIEQEEGSAWRYVHQMNPRDEFEIQRNKTAINTWQEHEVTWSHTDNVNVESEAAQELWTQGRGRGTGDGEFVRGLKMGDVVTIWGMARFGGWMNNVDQARIDIYWAV